VYFTIWKYDGIYGKIKRFYEEKCRKRQKARGKMIFRCKNCGGNVVYSPERKKMFCPFCESEDSEEREDGVIETSGEENGGKTALRKERSRQREPDSRSAEWQQPRVLRRKR